MHLSSVFDAERYTIKEACRALRVSRSHLYQRIKRRELATVKDGSRTFITGDELRRYARTGLSSTK